MLAERAGLGPSYPYNLLSDLFFHSLIIFKNLFSLKRIFSIF